MKNAFSRFIAVGVANTLLDVALFMAFQSVMHLVIANFLAASLAMIFSFIAHGRFTFKSESFSWQQALLFISITGTILWLIQPLIISGFIYWGLFDNLVGGAVLWAKIVAVGFCVVLNFILYRKVVWREESFDGAQREDS